MESNVSMSDRGRAFFSQLLSHGVVHVEDADLLREEDVHSAVEWIMQCESQTREHWPATPPDVDRHALVWATRHIFGAAQLAVFRHLGPPDIEKRLKEEFAEGDDAASTAYSVDVIFRYLPDLFRIVKGMNPDDPLLVVLRRWGERWPQQAPAPRGQAGCVTFRRRGGSPSTVPPGWSMTGSPG